MTSASTWNQSIQKKITKISAETHEIENRKTELMKAKTIGIIIDIVLFVIALVLIYFFSVRPAKKKMAKKK